MIGDPDLALVEGAQGGDRGAVEALLRRHYDRIHRIAWRLTGSKPDAEDIAQDVCCAVVEKLAGFKGQAKFVTWLVGITVNACRDRQRRGKTLTRLREGLSVLVRLSAPPDGRDLYRRNWLANEIAKLDPKVREAVVLIAGEDLSHAEAARALDVAESTVSGWMHQARRRWNVRMQEDASDGL